MQAEHEITEARLADALMRAATIAREHAAACLADSRHLPPSERHGLLFDVARASSLADRLTTEARSHWPNGGTER